jgi:hypothetical protein
MATTPDDNVPKLPRGRGLTLSRPAMVRIGGTILVLVFLLMMQRPCADSVSRLVTSFGSGSSGSGSAGSAASSSSAAPGAGGPGAAGSGSAAGGGSGEPRYEHLHPGMTEDEIKAVIDRARVKADGSGRKP